MKIITVHFILPELAHGKKRGKIICPSCGMTTAAIDKDSLHLWTQSSYAYSNMNHKYKACTDERAENTSSSHAKQGGLAKD
jgi:hypothetical protein